jgi:N-methylhydantoinase B
MGRHLTGHFCVAAVIGAFEGIVPERAIGDGGGVYIPQWFGRTEDGRVFAFNYFSNGGMGARYNKDGIHATSFPSNVKNTPVEVVENVAPLFFEKKEIIPDTGGIGKYRGGCGQSLAVRVESPFPAVISGLFERTRFPAMGRMGGGDGQVGEFMIRYGDGRVSKAHPKSKHPLPPGSCVILNQPGGGGYGPAPERRPESVLDDVIKGYVSADSAREHYRVAVYEKDGTFEIDWAQTRNLRNTQE